jgi:NADPH-dependent F420 reductase
MEIGLLGGTGDIGEGLALRWAYHTDHDVIVGSRNLDKARKSATDYEETLRDHDNPSGIVGLKNSEATARADVVVCCVPAYYLTDTIRSVSNTLEAGDIFVSPAVGMKHDEDGVHYNPPEDGSVVALADDTVPDGVAVIGTFHNIAAERLADLSREIEVHTPVVGDDPEAVDTVIGMSEEIAGLRSYFAGPLSNAPEVEALTPLLINLATHNDGLDDTAVKFE